MPSTPDAVREGMESSGSGETGKENTVKKLHSKKKRWWDVWKRWKEGEESNWWFASTGIPLLAATLGPLANVSSIAALVTSWRQTNIIDGVHVPDFEGVPYTDPRW
jgi:potassium channel subfamily K